MGLPFPATPDAIQVRVVEIQEIPILSVNRSDLVHGIAI
jgi:hypothetical protein